MLSFLSSRLPFVITFGCLLLLNWGVAVWLIHYTYQEREASTLQMINDEARYTEQNIRSVFNDADQALLGLRGRYSGDGTGLELDRWPPARFSGGVALI